MIPELVRADNASPWFVVASLALEPNVRGEELLEPFEPHHAREGDPGLEHSRATIFARIDRNVQIGIAYDRLGPEEDATPAHHHSSSGQTTTFDDSVGVGEQDALEQLVIGVATAGFRLVVGAGAAPEQVISQPSHLARLGGIDPTAAQRWCEAGRFRLCHQVEPVKDIRLRAGCEPPLALGYGALPSFALPDVLLGKKSGDRRTVASAMAFSRRHEQSCQPRVDRQSQDRLAQWRDPRWVAIHGPQKPKQALGLGEPLGIRSVKPIERRRVANAPGMERKNGAGKVDAVDLGLLELRAATLIALGPEPDAGPRPGPAGPPGALIGQRRD